MYFYFLHTSCDLTIYCWKQIFLAKIVVITIPLFYLWHVHWICYNKVILKEENEIQTADFDLISFYLLSNTTNKHSAKLYLVI